MVATRRRFNPNLQKVRVLIDGVAKRAYICTRASRPAKSKKRSSRNLPADRSV